MIFLLELIFPYLAFFYLADCFVHVKSFEVFLCSHFGDGFKTKGAGIRFIGLSPWCRIYRAIHLPFFLREDRLFYWKGGALEERDLYEIGRFGSVRLGDAARVECRGRRIVLHGSGTATLGSSPEAAWLAKKAEALIGVAPGERMQAFRKICSPPEAILAALARHSLLVVLLQGLSLALFTAVFVLLPSFLYLKAPLDIDLLVIMIVVLYTFTAGLAVRAHWVICGNRERFGLFLLTILLSPVSAVHTLHGITRDLAADVDWILLSGRLLPPGQFRPVLIKEMRRIRLSLERCRDPGLEQFLLEKEKACLPLLRKLGIERHEIMGSLQRRDAAAWGCCPLCETEFVRRVEMCPDCHVAVIRYDGPGAEGGAAE